MINILGEDEKFLERKVKDLKERSHKAYENARLLRRGAQGAVQDSDSRAEEEYAIKAAKMAEEAEEKSALLMNLLDKSEEELQALKAVIKAKKALMEASEASKIRNEELEKFMKGETHE